MHVAAFAFFDGVLRLIEIDPIIHKLQNEFSGKVDDRRNVVKDLAQIFFQEVVVGILLHLNEIGHFKNFGNMRKALSCPFSHLDVMHHCVHSLLMFSSGFFGRIPPPVEVAPIPSFLCLFVPKRLALFQSA